MSVLSNNKLGLSGFLTHSYIHTTGNDNLTTCTWMLSCICDTYHDVFVIHIMVYLWYISWRICDTYHDIFVIHIMTYLWYISWRICDTYHAIFVIHIMPYLWYLSWRICDTYVYSFDITLLIVSYIGLFLSINFSQ